MKLENQCFEYTEYEIDHGMKVLKFADQIAEGEVIPYDKRELISITAILHDIGIKEALLKYNSAAAGYQEKEGEIRAEIILKRVGYTGFSQHLFLLFSSLYADPVQSLLGENSACKNKIFRKAFLCPQ